MRTPSWHGFELNDPLAVVPCESRLALPTDSHRDFFALVSPPPDGDRLALLKNHMVPEDRRQLHIGDRRGRDD
jgi:hypothetical protein